MSHGTRTARRAFTLIELLVVVAIITTLIAILLPSLGNARERGRMVVCASIVRQFGIANAMYASEQNEKYVQPFEGDTAPWPDRLWAGNELFRSLLGLSNNDSEMVDHTTLLPSGMFCPNKEQVASNRPANEVYGMSVESVPSIIVSGVNGGWDSPVRTRIVRPSTNLQLTETNWSVITMARANHAVYWDIYGEDRAGGTGLGAAYRHEQGANVLFFDGHAAYMNKQDVYPDSADARASLWKFYK